MTPVRGPVLLSGACAAGALLWVSAPSPADALASLRTADTAVDPTAPVVAVLALAAQALVLWLAVALLATAASRLPGAAGRLGGLVARRCAPAAVRRALELALGLTVTVSTVGASPALAVTAGPHPAPAAAAAVAHTDGAAGAPRTGVGASHAVAQAQVPDLDWPLRTTTTRPAAPLVTPDRSAPGRSASDPAAPGTARATAPTSAAPASAAPTQSQPPSAAAPAPADLVVVRPGDTLWALAATALTRPGQQPPTPAAIARSWPRWWAANREVIGDDPHLILPGTALTPPDSASSRTTTTP